jgi:hypothetical protein
MSRGLGKLQREVKTVVVDYTEWFFREAVVTCPNPDNAPWLTWRIIRNLYFLERGFDFSPIGKGYAHANLERSMKRALKALVDRGEVCRIQFPFGWHYTTPEQFEKMKLTRLTQQHDQHQGQCAGGGQREDV